MIIHNEYSNSGVVTINSRVVKHPDGREVRASELVEGEVYEYDQDTGVMVAVCETFAVPNAH